MASVTDIALSALWCALAPPLVGLLLGIDRKITARMQRRVGPPILQPFYDLAKLFGKERAVLNPGQVAFALASLLFQGMALAALAFGGDMMAIFFLTSAGSLFLALGAFSARSPFSHLGAQRELLQILACEPVLFLVILVMCQQAGTFSASQLGGPLLYPLPLALLAMLPVLVIKLQKSPYDIAHAHTEIVSGPQVEYSGPYLGILELTHWVELALILCIVSLFWYDVDAIIAGAGRLALVIGAVFLAILLDNSTARLTRDRMVTFTLAVGLGLVVINMVWTVYIRPGVGW